jgi:hypothetical protein
MVLPPPRLFPLRKEGALRSGEQLGGSFAGSDPEERPRSGGGLARDLIS